jgi:hypothetical protein
MGSFKLALVLKQVLVGIGVEQLKVVFNLTQVFAPTGGRGDGVVKIVSDGALLGGGKGWMGGGWMSGRVDEWASRRESFECLVLNF